MKEGEQKVMAGENTSGPTWKVLTKQDLAAHINQDEIDAYTQLPEFKTEADPVGDLMEQVASYVRGFCRASGAVKIDTTRQFSIPNSLVNAAIDIIVYRMLSRMPMEVLESRKTAWQEAEQLLQKVQSRQFLPESYGVTDETNWSAVPIVGFSVRPDFTLRGNPTYQSGHRIGF